MRTLHGKTIKYRQIDDIIPERDAFLDADIYAKINEKINKNEDLYFMPFALHEMNTQKAQFKKGIYKTWL